MRVADVDILGVAKGLFAEKGYASVSTREIAQKAGISEMTLFRKFHTKRELLDRVISNSRLAISEVDPSAYESKKACFKAFIAMLFTAYEAQNDTSRIILTCPEIMDDAMFGLARDRLDFFQAEIRRFLIRLIEAEASGEESPTYNNEDFDLLAFYVCAQIIGFFLLNNILDISPPRAWSWEKIENDFADRLYGMIFGANSEIK